MRVAWPAPTMARFCCCVFAVWLAAVASVGFGADAKLDATELARRIDQAFERSWSAANVAPAAPASDAEFVRRIYLDLAGRIPSASEAREFGDDAAPGKRAALVENLVARATFAAYMASVFRDQLVPTATDDLSLRQEAPRLELWLRLKFIEHTPYDRMVRELLTAEAAQPQAMNAVAVRPSLEPSPRAFYSANEFKPENLAGSAAKTFLGVQLACAQCHDHPFADWKQEQFWSFAAFFSRTGQPAGDKAGPLEIEISDTGKKAPARFLDGQAPPESQADPRATLAAWITAPENPYFARAIVNRLWAHFFGLGLVEPVDDLNPANAPSQPEVFELLTQQCLAHGFDIEFLVQAITATRAYQLTSEAPPGVASGDESLLRHFARMPVRSLSAEQLFDSVVEATGYREPPSRNRNSIDAVLNSARAQFLNRFATSTSRRTEGEASILQALTLMNGTLVSQATSLEESQTLRAVVEAPFLDNGEKLDALFFATLSRPPRADEREPLWAALESAPDAKNRDAALSDVFWALVNSSEFLTNH